ncbi:glycosyltransferase [Edwardsiella tarda]|uniref:glycosyltransferase n=1 Tax=Edwardsiella tarda TaxID=636 RepID=UPI00351C4A0D
MSKFIFNKAYSLLKDIYLYVVSHLRRGGVISKELFLFKEDSGGLDRDKFDSLVGGEIKRVKELSKKLPSISAIYRVKNGAEYIEAAILSVAPIVKEIIVIDNGSIDETKSIIKKLQIELTSIVEIKLFEYSEKLELAGDGYLERVKNNPNGSLAKFYSYCFSLGSSDYLMKCDAHYIFTLKGICSLQEKLKYNPDVIYFSGCEIYGKELNYEPSLFRRDSGYRFVDNEKWEKLEFQNTKSIYVYTPVFLHVKRLAYIKSISCVEMKSYIDSKYNK